MTPEELQAAALGAPAPHHARIDTAEGRELLPYGPGPDHADGGVLIVPTVLLGEGR